MQFNSLVFIFIFLPVVLCGWYAFNRFRLRKLAVIWLILTSLWFYGYGNAYYLILIIGSTILNFFISFLLQKAESYNRFILALGIFVNLAILAYYKYRNFFFDNLNSAFNTDIKIVSIVLPLGISFFTLQQIAFLVDRYRKEAPHYDFLHYAAFVLYFPKLMSGPIPYHNEFMGQLEKTSFFEYKDFTLGLFRFAMGMSKKILLADVLSKYVSYALENVFAIDCPTAWLTALAYSMELYFDFSGYCDMALGVSLMLGISLPENFDAPYRAKSVKDFWKRWHITLTRFLTKYIYIPLGGSREGSIRKIINTLIVFAISGLWHGASWNYVIWGLMHGVAILTSGTIHKKYRENWLSHGFTMIFVVVAWAVFRIEDLDILKVFLSKMFSLNINGFAFDWCSVATTIPEMYVISKALASKWAVLKIVCVIVTASLLGVSVTVMSKGSVPSYLCNKEKGGFKMTWIMRIALLFAWSVISLSEVSTFLYFTF